MLNRQPLNADALQILEDIHTYVEELNREGIELEEKKTDVLEQHTYYPTDANIPLIKYLEGKSQAYIKVANELLDYIAHL